MTNTRIQINIQHQAQNKSNRPMVPCGTASSWTPAWLERGDPVLRQQEHGAACTESHLPETSGMILGWLVSIPPHCRSCQLLSPPKLVCLTAITSHHSKVWISRLPQWISCVKHVLEVTTTITHIILSSTHFEKSQSLSVHKALWISKKQQQK